MQSFSGTRYHIVEFLRYKFRHTQLQTYNLTYRIFETHNLTHSIGHIYLDLKNLTHKHNFTHTNKFHTQNLTHENAHLKLGTQT